MTTSSDALRIIDQVRYSRLGVVMDTGHINLTGETTENIIKTLGKRLLQWHVNDNDGQRQQNKIPGEGSFNFAAFVETLRQANYQGFLSLELGWDHSFAPAPAVTQGLERLHAILH